MLSAHAKRNLLPSNSSPLKSVLIPKVRTGIFKLSAISDSCLICFFFKNWASSTKTHEMFFLEFSLWNRSNIFVLSSKIFAFFVRPILEVILPLPDLLSFFDVMRMEHQKNNINVDIKLFFITNV